MMIRMVGGWVFLLVPAHPGSPGQRAVKQLLLLFPDLGTTTTRSSTPTLWDSTPHLTTLDSWLVGCLGLSFQHNLDYTAPLGFIIQLGIRCRFYKSFANQVTENLSYVTITLTITIILKFINLIFQQKAHVYTRLNGSDKHASWTHNTNSNATNTQNNDLQYWILQK